MLDADEGITADPNVRLALNLAVDKQAIVEADLRRLRQPSTQGQLLSPSILGYNDTLDAYPYDPEQAKQLIKDAGVAGQTITPRRRVVGTMAERPRPRRGGRRLLERGRARGRRCRRPEFGAYLDVLFDRNNREDAIYVSSSNDMLDPDRQLTTYYQAGGIGSSNSDQELSALIDQGRSSSIRTLAPATYQQAVKLAYDDNYFVFLVSNQDLYGLSERMVWTPRVDSKLLVKDMTVTG